MLVACSGNRQTFQQIRTGSSSPARMRAFLVIVYAPGFDFAPYILQRHESVLVQTLLSQPAVERLYVYDIPPALPPEHDVNSAVAIVQTDLPLAGPIACLQVTDPFAQARQRQFFFASTSCSMGQSQNLAWGQIWGHVNDCICPQVSVWGLF